MKNNEHTPGEWIISEHNMSTDNILIKPIGGQVVCEIDPVPNAMANARLISAAPDLLEALQLAASIIDRLSDDYSAIAKRHANFTRGESNTIENAIKKAKIN